MKKAILNRLWYYLIGLPLCLALGVMLIIRTKFGNLL
jgi:hypothetical protein